MSDVELVNIVCLNDTIKHVNSKYYFRGEDPTPPDVDDVRPTRDGNSYVIHHESIDIKDEEKDEDDEG